MSVETDVIFFLLLSFATMKQFFERLRSERSDERSEEHERMNVTYVRIIAGGGKHLLAQYQQFLT